MAQEQDPFDSWTAVAAEWSVLWGGFADPVRKRIIEVAGIGTGSRVLDVGCGSGEFIRMLAARGAYAVGVDPSLGMVRLSGARARLTDAEHLPWPDGTFDVVTAVNALHLADDPIAALDEARRVLVPGGLVAVANWAEAELSDFTALEAAVAAFHEEELPPDGQLRTAGGLEALLTDASIEPIAAGVVDLDWTPPNDDALVRGVLLGEDPVTIGEARPVVLAAAEPFRTGAGFVLRNSFRYVVGRASAS